MHMFLLIFVYNLQKYLKFNQIVNKIKYEENNKINEINYKTCAKIRNRLKCDKNTNIY